MSATGAALSRRALSLRLDAAALAMLGLFALGAAVIWIAPRPLMIDLPQHAAQVALLRDMALGRSPFAGEIRINLVTPYLIGYGLALPLAYVMSAGAALKSVLTLAYAGFIVVCMGIRAELGATRKLDPYAAISFFGFAFVWGMYTFLVAAPVGLGFIWLTIRYARQGLWRQGVGLAVLGVALLISHGLVFLFAGAVGGLILLVRAESFGRLVRRSWPFWILAAAAGVFFVLTRERETAVAHNFGTRIFYGHWDDRLLGIAVNAFDVPTSPWPALCFPIIGVLPLIAGLKPDWRSREALAIFAGTLAALLLAPSYAWSTSLVAERFALFLPPAYAWLFREPAATPSGLAGRLQPRLGILAGLACGLILAQHARLAFAFGREQRDFETVLAAARPGERALALIFHAGSRVDRNNLAYLHHAVWYQADKQGFVDFNFASFHPQIARFRPEAIPPIDEYLAQDPRRFDWRANRGDRYRYIFLRSLGPPGAQLFAGADCAPVQVAAAGEWRLYERRPCPVR